MRRLLAIVSAAIVVAWLLRRGSERLAERRRYEREPYYRGFADGYRKADPFREPEDGLPPADPWPVALADPEFVRGMAEAAAEHDAGEFRPFRHVVPMNEENTNNAPWYVASCGFAHPWGICHGHRYTLTGEAP